MWKYDGFSFLYSVMQITLNDLFEMKGLTKEEFESQLTKSGDHLLYLNGLTTRGYGRMLLDGERVYAMRVAYAFAHNKTLKEIKHLEVINLCGEKACCNPAHLAARYKKK